MKSALHVAAVLLVAASLVAAQSRGAPRQDAVPPMPFEDEGACPFEGCVYREWVAKSAVQVRADRRPNAAVAFEVRAGETITALSGVVVTTTAGRVGFRRAAVLTSAEGDLEVRSGQILHLLTPEDEGFWTAWFQGRVYHEVDGGVFSSPGCRIDPTRCPADILTRPQSVWWVQIRNAEGQIGWTNEPDTFDGKDALSEAGT